MPTSGPYIEERQSPSSASGVEFLLLNYFPDLVERSNIVFFYLSFFEPGLNGLLFAVDVMLFTDV